MKITVDLENCIVTMFEKGEEKTYPLTSEEAFRLVSRAWLRAGWDVKHVYTFTWLGRPIIQLPDDLLRIQEVIFTIKPTLIIETGVAHGGSLVFYASLLKAMGINGRVIGIDIEIRPHNRKAIESHFLFPYITLIEGNSIDKSVVSKVQSLVKSDDIVMVMLDSKHTKEHVLSELEAYSPLVTPGSYIIAMDGIMHWLGNAPRTQPDWSWNNPKEAAEEFLRHHPEFELAVPEVLFNESLLTEPVSAVTYWPSAWLRRKTIG